MSERKDDFGLRELHEALTLKELTEGFAAEAFKNSDYARGEIKAPFAPRQLSEALDLRQLKGAEISSPSFEQAGFTMSGLKDYFGPLELRETLILRLINEAVDLPQLRRAGFLPGPSGSLASL